MGITTRTAFEEIRSEMIGYVTAPPGFNVLTFLIQPGIAATFPWLSGIATNFQTYRFERLSFEYRTRVSEYVAGAGSIVGYVDYSNADAPADTYQAAGNMETATSNSPYRGMTVTPNPTDMSRGIQLKGTRRQGENVNNLPLYDSGRFHLCTDNPDAQTLWGEIWVHYHVRFFTPQATLKTTYNVGAKTIFQSTLTKTVEDSNPNPIVPIGSTPVVDQLNLGDYTTNGVTIKQDGQYLLKCISDMEGEAAAGDAGVKNTTNVIHEGSVTSTTITDNSIPDVVKSLAESATDFVINGIKGDLIRVDTIAGFLGNTLDGNLKDTSWIIEYLAPIFEGFVLAEELEKRSRRNNQLIDDNPELLTYGYKYQDVEIAEEKKEYLTTELPLAQTRSSSSSSRFLEVSKHHPHRPGCAAEDPALFLARRPRPARQPCDPTCPGHVRPSIK
jgi:hypothetical protein